MNVVVVAAHGLNCHWLGPYGNEWVSTPAFDALAGEAVVFDQPLRRRPVAGRLRDQLPAGPDPSPPAARGSDAFCGRPQGPDSGRPVVGSRVRTDPASHSTPGDALIAAVESALDRLGAASPWLLWVETDRLLPPWDFDAETYQHYASASGGFAEGDGSEPSEARPTPIDDPTPGRFAADDDLLWHRLHNSFAAAVTSFDAELGVLDRDVSANASSTRRPPGYSRPGYGWPLGEHGVVGPTRRGCTTELVHLPLLIRLAGQRPGHAPGPGVHADGRPGADDSRPVRNRTTRRYRRSLLPLTTRRHNRRSRRPPGPRPAGRAMSNGPCGPWNGLSCRPFRRRANRSGSTASRTTSGK